MEYDEKRIDEAVLGLLTAFSFDNGNAWKGFDFEVMNRLHAQGLISNPVGKQKSICLTPEGQERGRQIAEALFGGGREVIRMLDSYQPPFSIV